MFSELVNARALREVSFFYIYMFFFKILPGIFFSTVYKYTQVHKVDFAQRKLQDVFFVYFLTLL